MKVSYNWLKSYIPTSLPAEKLAERFTLSGTEVVGLEKVSGDQVFDFEITPNRSDCLSVLGIAREAGTLLNRKLKEPTLSNHRTMNTSKGKAFPRIGLPLSIQIADKKGCARYIGRAFDQAQVLSSPKWLRDRLISIGQRPINTVVDITNFCLMESGQPLHAFDYDKVKGAAIIVRRARKNEKIVCLNGVEYTLDESILVITDSEKPIAIAGIMGGKGTEVTESTQRVLLESAYFDPVRVRRASRKLALTTDSSYRFERQVDWKNVAWTSERASRLMGEMSKARPASKVIDVKTSPPPREKKIDLEMKELVRVLGSSLLKGRCRRILEHLGFSAKLKRSSIAVTVPSFRKDVLKPIDLIEEIIRIEGFDKVSLKLPQTIYALDKSQEYGNRSYQLTAATRQFLSAIGLSELITYSLISGEWLKSCQLPRSRAMRIKNPLSLEQEYLRPSLMPGLLNAAGYNVRRKAKNVRFF